MSDLDEVVDASGVSSDVLDALLDLSSEEVVEPVVDATREAYLRERMVLAKHDATVEGLLFFDLETVPDELNYPRPKLCDPIALGGELDAVLANPKNTVDQIKECLKRGLIAAEIDKIEQAERKGKNRAGVIEACNSARGGGNPEFEEWRKLALNPIGLRIVALGWAIGKGYVRSFIATNEAEEKQLLEAFWMLFSEGRQHCGFNTLAFDVGAIGFRSMILRVKARRALNRSKYSNREAIDIYQMLFPFGSPGGCDCKSLCRRMGIHVEAGDVDGSQVLGLWDAEDYEAIAAYVESDVKCERDLFYRCSSYFA